IIAILTNVFRDERKFRTFLNYRGDLAQKVIDLLHMLLDCPLLEDYLKPGMLTALSRLSERSSLYPRCFTLKNVQRGESSVAGGNFGDIWKGQFRGHHVCLKVIRVNRQSRLENLMKAFSREAILWGHVSHPNILPFYGIYRLEDSQNRFCLVSPWMVNGNINDYLIEHPEECRLLLVSDIIAGICYLHDRDIVHGDLKGANILVTNSGRACLADFGLSHAVNSESLRWASNESTIQIGGTIRWQAPELNSPTAEDSITTKEADIYAFACVCYEIFTGFIPFFEIQRDLTVMLKVMQGLKPSRPVRGTSWISDFYLTDHIWEILEDCWQEEPFLRPSAAQVSNQLPTKLNDGRPSGEWDTLPPSYFR
ncbi:kinase-like domain-containing protein, partial [Crucibulum laeve]